VKQDGKEQKVVPKKDADGSYVLYQAVPNAGMVSISGK
jgi:hypothetical protein